MYKLEGFDKEWLPVGESPVATYANLTYGDYTFRVRASNGNGLWNKEEAAVEVFIFFPPFTSQYGLILRMHC